MQPSRNPVFARTARKRKQDRYHNINDDPNRSGLSYQSRRSRKACGAKRCSTGPVAVCVALEQRAKFLDEMSQLRVRTTPLGNGLDTRHHGPAEPLMEPQCQKTGNACQPTNRAIRGTRLPALPDGRAQRRYFLTWPFVPEMIQGRQVFEGFGFGVRDVCLTPVEKACTAHQ